MIIRPVVLLWLVLGLTVGSLAHASWFDSLSEAVKEHTSTDAAATTNSPLKLSSQELASAFKQALDIGSQKVVDQLGQVDGFNGDSTIRIPLPDKLKTVESWLDKVGLAGPVTDLETSLNRAAEHAAPKARAIFVEAIKAMSFDDVKAIYHGSDDAATRYFEKAMSPSLREAMTPVVDNSLSEVGAVKLYQEVMSDYQSIPFVPDVKADLTRHVVDGGLHGVFHYLAKEEAAIRKDPVKRTTDLLKKVFSQ